MNQFTIAKIDTIKEGEGEHGHWTLRKITFKDKLEIFEQNGTKHEFMTGSTFDKAELQPGQVIEAECSVDDKGYLNLKKITLSMARATPPASAPANPPAIKPVQQATYPDRNESIERQVVAKILFENAFPMDDTTFMNRQKYFEPIFQLIHNAKPTFFPPAIDQRPPQKAQDKQSEALPTEQVKDTPKQTEGAESFNPLIPGAFKDITSLVNYAKTKGMTPAFIKKACGLEDLRTANLDDLAKLLFK